MMACARIDWTEALQELGVLIENEPMSRHTTIAVGGPARWFFRPASRDALVQALRRIPADLPLLPLGRGSNLLVADTGFSGIVVDLGNLDAVELTGRDVRAEAGARMSRVARLCAEHGLAGLEFLATVPGDIGGGVAMNAGAFGQQVSDTLVEVEIVDRRGTRRRMPASALDLGYRRCRLPEGALVLQAGFRLDPDDPRAIRERMRAMRARRSATQPLAQPNCGSVFKNPPGDHAARLIEAAGLKGMTIGGAQISERHANFIVNLGDASCADVLALIERVRRVIRRDFDIELEPEVRIVGVEQ